MNKKKQIAALSAVMYVLKAEEEENAVQYQPNFARPWAMQGRQTVMQNRNLVQRRLVRR